MSIMNMPPLPYLARLPGLDVSTLAPCFTDASVWQSIDPARITLASPDPQAFRPPGEKPNVLQVSLPTNFKVARFEGDEPTALLRQLEADIAAVRQDTGADAGDLVPFEKYARAAEGLVKPSSAARALYAGALAIERVDLLVQSIARQYDMRSAEVDETVRRVNERLEANRRGAA